MRFSWTISKQDCQPYSFGALIAYGDDTHEDGIGKEGGREAKKRKKRHKSCRRDVGNGGDLGGKRK